MNKSAEKHAHAFEARETEKSCIFTAQSIERATERSVDDMHFLSESTEQNGGVFRPGAHAFLPQLVIDAPAPQATRRQGGDGFRPCPPVLHFW